MSVLFQKSQGPTRINQVQINQSVLGYCVPVLMGRGKVQQTVVWVDGFTGNKVNSSGGKGGGGKGGDQYAYSANVISALCAGGKGGLLGIGDVWSGQSWLKNTDTSETYTVTGSTPSYTPVNATQMTGNLGVSVSQSVSGSYGDLGAPSSTTILGSALVALQQAAYDAGSPNSLSSGTYSIGPDNTYYFSPADDGQAFTLSYTFSLSTVTKQVNALIPSGLSVAVGDSSGLTPVIADLGVVYYNTGSTNGNALTYVTGTPTAAGTYSYSGSSPRTYTFASADLDKEVQITFQIDNSHNVSAGTQTSLSFMLLNGAPGQEPWALLLTNFPGAALGYTGVALVCFAPMDLGYGGQIQQNLYEGITADGWGGGIADCNPVQCVMQVASNPVWGLGAGPIPFPLSAIDNGTGGTWGTGNAGNGGNGALAAVSVPGSLLPEVSNTATAWFAANNFFISPVIDKQDTAASLIARWLEAGLCAAYMSEGLWKLVGYGDTSACANGQTWTAPNAFAAVLDDSCFVIKGKGQDPVKISMSTDYQSAWNTVQVSWANRANQYAPEITPESDKAAILRYGSRIEDPQSYDFITTLPAATFAASMRVKRSVYLRNVYEFTLPFRYGHLEPMDIVAITTNNAWSASGNNTLQIVNQPVRITKIVDNPDGTYDLTCEDYLWGINQPAAYAKALSSPAAAANWYADPGNATAVIFEATNRLTSYKGCQLWIGASGANALWGGCNVLASFDSTKYTEIGTIETPAAIGALTATFPSGSDPDTTNALMVSLVGPAVLESSTAGDADQGLSLCYVDGEIIAYSAAAVTGDNLVTMDTYIRRGQMGSSIAGHAVAAPFLRLDNAVMKYTYDPSWVGKTVYLKFQSFNAFGNSLQDISTLTPVTFIVPGVNTGAIDPTNGTLQNTSGSTTSGSTTLAVSPASLSVNAATTFSATINGSPAGSGTVTWSIAFSSFPGGAAAIDSSGNFSISGSVTHGGCTVVCTLVADPTITATASVGF